MKLLDKAKAAAEQAAVKAKEGVEDVQTKRDLNNAHSQLGEKTFALVETGELHHDALTELVERIRGLKAKLAEETVTVEPTHDGPTQPPAMPT